MSCDECRELIELEELGMITSKQLYELEAHVKLCPECLYLRQTSQEMTSSLKSLPILSAPDDLFSLIIYRIEKEAFIKNSIMFASFMFFVFLIGSFFMSNIDYSVFSVDIEESVLYIFEVIFATMQSNISLVYLLMSSFLLFIAFSVYKKRKELLS